MPYAVIRKCMSGSLYVPGCVMSCVVAVNDVVC